MDFKLAEFFAKKIKESVDERGNADNLPYM